MLRFLKDINNRFHAGSGITFHERLVGVVELDEANRNQVLACSSLSGFSLGVCVCCNSMHLVRRGEAIWSVTACLLEQLGGTNL